MSPRRAFLAVFPYLIFVLLLAVSWQRWIEPYVDTGRELMIPWRLGHGEPLYGRLHFHHGPLAPYLGALLDLLTGPSLRARIGLGIALALFHLEALRRIALQFLPDSRASLATAAAVATAFFLKPGGWIFPFSFDTAVAVAGLSGAVALLSRNHRRADVAVGVCLAAALLSRLELGLAGVAAAAWDTRRVRSRWTRICLAPLAAAAAGYLAVSWGVPFERLVRDGWLALIQPPAAFQNVYRTYAGLDVPVLRLTELALVLVVGVLAASLLVAGAAIAQRAGPWGHRIAVGLTLAVLGVAAAVRLFPPTSLAAEFALFPPLVRLVPPLVLLGCAADLLRRLGGRTVDDAIPADAILLLGALFAARLLLAAGYVGPYDAFFLPLLLLLVFGLLFRGAEALARPIGAALPSLTAAALVVFLASRAVWEIQRDRSEGWASVSTPAGDLRLKEPVATTTRLVLYDLSRRLPAGATLTGFPEAGFFNYVLGRRNPLDREQFFPGHVETAAEETRVIERLEESPPDALLVCNVLAIGEHRPAFGTDYLVRLGGFLRTRFAAAASYGPGAGPESRIGDPQFFVTIRVPREGASPRP